MIKMESLLNTQLESKYPMVEVAQALDLALAKAKELHLSKQGDIVAVAKHIGQMRVGDTLALDVVARDDLPPFHASVMDGYALSTIENYESTSYFVEESLKSLAGRAPTETSDQTAASD